MPRQKTGNKAAALRNAAIDELVAHGLSSASVNRIAERAEVSIGTLYRYYQGKDALFSDCYLHLKQDLSQVMLTATQGQETPDQKIWAALKAYAQHALAAPEHVICIEILSNSKILDKETQDAVAAIEVDLIHLLQSGVDDGSLRPAPLTALATMLLAPIIHTARRIALGGSQPEPAYMNTLIEMCWNSVRNPNK